MSFDADNSGLSQFGVYPDAVVRAPARRADETVVCPECGKPVEDSKGTHQLDNPPLVDHDLRARFQGPLLVHGWVCERHHYDVVSPVLVDGEKARALGPGWTGVELVFADEQRRWVGTPQQELEEHAV